METSLLRSRRPESTRRWITVQIHLHLSGGGQTPSMRRPVCVKSVFLFLLVGVFVLLNQSLAPLFENLVAALRHSANLLHSRSPFSCASSTSIIGSVAHPVGTGLLIPSGKSR